MSFVVAVVTACGNGTSNGTPDGTGDGTGDGYLVTDVGDIADDVDVDVDAGPIPQPRELVVEGPNRPLPGVKTPVAVRTDAAFSGRIQLRAGDQTFPIDIRHGRGSAAVALDTPETLASATPNTVLFGRDGRSLAHVPEPEDDRDFVVTSEHIVPAGETRVITAGTRVLLGPKARIVVHGVLRIEGTATEPVLVTSRTSEPFGTIEIRGGSATFEHVWFTNGGARTQRFGGHSDSDPVVAVVDGDMTMTGGGIVDNPGKAIWAERSRVHLENMLISRCDTGGEYVSSVLTMLSSHTLEIPDGDGVPDDDDNDGIYLRRSLEVDGVPVPSQIEGCVFAFGEDDGIDHNGAHVEIVGTHIDGFRNEGIAASDRGEVIVRDTVVTNNTQGIEAGYGGPAVRITNSLLTSNGTGLRWGDSYPWDATGTIDVSRSIIVGNDVDIDLHDPQQGQAPEGAVTIACSVLGDVAWSSRNDNAKGTPRNGSLCPILPVMATTCASPIGPDICQ